MCRRHERGHLFVSDLHELDRTVRPRQRADDAADAVARITVDALHAPRLQAFPEKSAVVAMRVAYPARH
jgi:hypothetical protein